MQFSLPPYWFHSLRSIYYSEVVAERILNCQCTYRPVQNTMEVLRTTNKGRHMNTLGNYHIYGLRKQDQHLDEPSTDNTNSIFEALLEHNLSSFSHSVQH